MKLKLEFDFDLEVGEDTYSGTFTDLTKKQIKEIDKMTPAKALKESSKINTKIKRLEEKIANARELSNHNKIDEYYAKLELLEDKLLPLMNEVDTFDLDNVFKRRLELSIGGDDKAEVLKVGEEYGYQRVFNTIMEDIAKSTKGN